MQEQNPIVLMNFSGIYRDVYLYTVPDTHAYDLQIRAIPEENLDVADLEIKVKTWGKGSIVFRLEQDGECVLEEKKSLTEAGNEEANAEPFYIQKTNSSKTVQNSFAWKINNPKLWSAEDPQLYDLTIELYDEAGNIQEVIPQKVGFRRFVMKNGIMTLNGKRIVFKGVNRHEFSSVSGRHVSEEELRKDLRIMKQNNINAIRTCHYPDTSLIYQLCDEYGIYMIDETNLESHGSWDVAEFTKDYTHVVPHNKPEWLDMMLDRANSMYQRDKNHPAILIWSCGNESFGGKDIYEMSQLFRKNDSTRLVHYEGLFHDRSYNDTSDMESQMYPSVEAIKEFLAKDDSKPFICCEYTHAMGNSCGAMHKYTDLTDTEPKYQGGFIWDYIDQSIYKKDRYGKEFQAYGGDFGERPTDYNFSGNGIAYGGDREPSPKMQEVKFNYQNITAEVTADTVKVINKNLFVNTNIFDCKVILAKNGKVICTEALETAVEPLSEEEYKLPFEKAEAAGISPKEYVDQISGEVKRIWDLVNSSYDNFVRTTDEDHEKCVKKIFKKLYDQGDIYKGSYEGLYCTPCESFWTESQLVDGKCPDCGREVKPAKEEAYFFKMSKYADRLIEHINTHPEFIQPVSRKNEMMNNFLLPGLQDLCVSRTSFSWGIPVDFDPKHVVYVWLDALTNYITKIGYDPDGSSELFQKNWPADLHLIGKDIVRFHTIYWPIFLMALDLPLPKQVFGHPWLLQGGDKMSKSKGNVIYADDMVRLFGVDATRYFVLHEMPFENDGVITWELVIERFNSDLANILGNLVNRTISMSNKYFDGVVRKTGVTAEVDEDLKAVVTGTRDKVQEKMDKLRVADAITAVFDLFRRCNKYIDETTPWVLAKDEADHDRLAEVLYNLTESITIGAGLLHSFLPETAEKIVNQLNTTLRDYDDLDKFGLYESGSRVTDTPEILFARLDAKEVMPKVEEIKAAQKAEFEAEQKKLAGETETAEEAEESAIDIEPKAEIEYDDFMKMQFQVGEIIACEAVPKSKKLLCSQVKIGSQVKQIVSGIRKHYTPEEMVGKKVMVLVNLKPAKLAGVVSEGMLLCAEDENGELALMVPEKKMPSGAEIC